MHRFDRQIRPSMTVREVRVRFPQTVAVLEEFGFRAVCDDCSLEIVARRQELNPADVIDALNMAIVRQAADNG